MRIILQAFAFLILFHAISARADELSAQSLDPQELIDRYRKAAPQWPEVPEHVLKAFVAAEDPRFFDRLPQYSAIMRQLTRFKVLGTSRFLELAFAFIIGGELSHDEILNWYVNEVYFGQSCYGIEGAAQAYFGKSVEDLDLAEAAYLAGLLKAPNFYHPVRSYDRALSRRDFVIAQMSVLGFISEDEATEAYQTDLVVTDPVGRCEIDEPVPAD